MCQTKRLHLSSHSKVKVTVAFHYIIYCSVKQIRDISYTGSTCQATSLTQGHTHQNLSKIPQFLYKKLCVSLPSNFNPDFCMHYYCYLIQFRNAKHCLRCLLFELTRMFIHQKIARVWAFLIATAHK